MSGVEVRCKRSWRLRIDDIHSEHAGTILINFNATTRCCRCQSDRPCPDCSTLCRRLVLSRQSALVSQSDSPGGEGVGRQADLSTRILLRNPLLITSNVQLDAAQGRSKSVETSCLPVVENIRLTHRAGDLTCCESVANSYSQQHSQVRKNARL